MNGPRESGILYKWIGLLIPFIALLLGFSVGWGLHAPHAPDYLLESEDAILTWTFKNRPKISREDSYLEHKMLEDVFYAFYVSTWPSADSVLSDELKLVFRLQIRAAFMVNFRMLDSAGLMPRDSSGNIITR